jgi:sugar O-acyltransferase (sialic acid O-acetyltransferase NeuD family)
MPARHMTNLLLIWGAGGHGKVVLDIARRIGRFDRIAFLDDDLARADSTFCDCPLIGGPEELHSFAGSAFIVAIGNNLNRSQRFGDALEYGLVPTALVHPTAIISPSAHIGPGTVVMPGVIVNASATIGENCIINSGAIVEHDCRIEAHVHISPRVVLGGGVSVDPLAHIGIGAVVLPGASVGRESIVGAGAVVLKEVPSHCTVVGVPARGLSCSLQIV